MTEKCPAFLCQAVPSLSKTGAVAFSPVSVSIPKAPSASILSTAERSADRAFVDPTVFGYLIHSFVLKIIGYENLTLLWCQLIIDHLFQTLNLNLPRKPRTFISIKELFSCHSNLIPLTFFLSVLSDSMCAIIRIFLKHS